MRTTSRTIVAVLLGFGLALLAGCGSKPEPQQPTPPEGGPGGDPKPAPQQPVVGPATYETDVAKHAIPSGPVSGVLGGEKVTGEARLEGRTLLFRKPESAAGPAWQVWIDLPPEALRGEPLELLVRRHPPPRAPPGSSPTATHRRTDRPRTTGRGRG